MEQDNNFELLDNEKAKKVWEHFQLKEKESQQEKFRIV